MPATGRARLRRRGRRCSRRSQLGGARRELEAAVRRAPRPGSWRSRRAPSRVGRRCRARRAAGSAGAGRGALAEQGFEVSAGLLAQVAARPRVQDEVGERRVSGRGCRGRGLSVTGPIVPEGAARAPRAAVGRRGRSGGHTSVTSAGPAGSQSLTDPRYDGGRAPVAQWTERGRPKACVGGSSPSGGARNLQRSRVRQLRQG